MSLNYNKKTNTFENLNQDEIKQLEEIREFYKENKPIITAARSKFFELFVIEEDIIIDDAQHLLTAISMFRMVVLETLLVQKETQEIKPNIVDWKKQKDLEEVFVFGLSGDVVEVNVNLPNDQHSLKDWDWGREIFVSVFAALKAKKHLSLLREFNLFRKEENDKVIKEGNRVYYINVRYNKQLQILPSNSARDTNLMPFNSQESVFKALEKFGEREIFAAFTFLNKEWDI